MLWVRNPAANTFRAGVSNDSNLKVWQGQGRAGQGAPEPQTFGAILHFQASEGEVSLVEGSDRLRKGQTHCAIVGRGGDVDRLEGQLAQALTAESRARAELIEERGARQAEAAGAQAALQASERRSKEVQARLASTQEANERLVQEQDVSNSSRFPPPFTLQPSG